MTSLFDRRSSHSGCPVTAVTGSSELIILSAGPSGPMPRTHTLTHTHGVAARRGIETHALLGFDLVKA